jgi:hypothetical protein
MQKNSGVLSNDLKPERLKAYMKAYKNSEYQR